MPRGIDINGREVYYPGPSMGVKREDRPQGPVTWLHDVSDDPYEHDRVLISREHVDREAQKATQPKPSVYDQTGALLYDLVVGLSQGRSYIAEAVPEVGVTILYREEINHVVR